MTYKEWLRKRIEHYEDLKLWGDLSKNEELWLASYKEYYQEILENEEVKK